MEPYSTRESTARQSIVTTVLTGMVGMIVVMLFVLIGGSLAFYLVGVVAAIFAFGGVHYLLWGRLLTAQTAGEREEEELRQRALADDGPEDSDRPD
jgi:threonine/homoserine/homoserine lactone efflux protein